MNYQLAWTKDSKQMCSSWISPKHLIKSVTTYSSTNYRITVFRVTSRTGLIEAYKIPNPGRTQSVVVEGEKSDVDVNGTPGSLSVSVLHINDLPETLRSRVRLFADDTIVYLTITSAKDTDRDTSM